MVEALEIRVRGIVQGVGFRPFVYKLARHMLISGWVLNDKEGVFIHAEGESEHLDEFTLALAQDHPPSAIVNEVDIKEVPLLQCVGFEIRESESSDHEDITKISPDLGICDDCRSELLNPDNRRFRYPFINCTNCGPRYTIIKELPYDRPNTSMGAFTMGPLCQAEYNDPADRRFHAQPDACFSCGPQINWYSKGEELSVASGLSVEEARAASDAILAKATAAIASGEVVAVKGLGGFHLVCDASSAESVAKLRQVKQRDGKPFAVMVQDVEAAHHWCEVSPEEALQLESPARPIVLLKKKADANICEGLADGLQELGVMLPATPVQELLIRDFAAAADSASPAMLVMTSGNLHDEPIICEDAVAIEVLGEKVAGILGNNRPILSRFDDSVVRVVTFDETPAVQFIRRARGYAPLAVGKPAGASVFAAGSEQKNTFTITRERDGFVSSHIGDLSNADTFDAWLETKERMESLFDLHPKALACDLHPDYVASKWARAEAFKTGLPLTEVQHHHAHVVSVLGEHDLEGPVLGFAFDGTGYGPDGAIWGGEALVSNLVDYERFANFVYFPLPGGEAAVKHPRRTALGLLWAYDLQDHPGASAMLKAMGDEATLCEQMIESGLNTPYTSSVGRLFDGVSALLGLCDTPAYDGQAAMLLDAARAKLDSEEASGEDASNDEAASYSYNITFQKNAATATSTAHDTSVVLLDCEELLRGILDDLDQGLSAAAISLKFHNGLVACVLATAELARSLYDINTVALSGGCFMNRYLLQKSVEHLGAAGFTVAVNGALPPNDGCVSYGQAVVASVSR